MRKTVYSSDLPVCLQYVVAGNDKEYHTIGNQGVKPTGQNSRSPVKTRGSGFSGVGVFGQKPELSSPQVLAGQECGTGIDFLAWTRHLLLFRHKWYSSLKINPFTGIVQNYPAGTVPAKVKRGSSYMKGAEWYACGGPSFLILAFVLLFIYSVNDTEFGENKATSPVFNAEKGSHFSYYVSYLNRFVEFTISEQDFLNWCKDRGWEPFDEIKNLPVLPRPPEPNWHNDSDAIWVNQRRGREIPLAIIRYNHIKEEHEACNPFLRRCRIDSTGRTDQACVRLIGDGYYYEHRWADGGGVYILYDRENNRCYVQWSRR